MINDREATPVAGLSPLPTRGYGKAVGFIFAGIGGTRQAGRTTSFPADSMVLVQRCKMDSEDLINQCVHIFDDFTPVYGADKLSWQAAQLLPSSHGSVRRLYLTPDGPDNLSWDFLDAGFNALSSGKQSRPETLSKYYAYKACAVNDLPSMAAGLVPELSKCGYRVRDEGVEFFVERHYSRMADARPNL